MRLFEARPPIPFLPPAETRPKSSKKIPPLSGVGQYLELFKDHDKDYVPTETAEDRKKRKVYIIAKMKSF
jgi:hypothetical protein